MSPAKILRAARERIAVPGAWCQGSMAQDESGSPTFSTSPTACAWCMVGAVRAVSGEAYDAERAALDYLDVAIQRMGRSPERFAVEDWNDRRRTRHPMVLKRFDRAIALAEAP